MKIMTEDYSPYCKVCGGCGEDGCCSALMCEQSKDGDYCETYLTELKINYYCHRELLEYVYKNKDMYMELISKISINYNKAYDRYINNENNGKNKNINKYFIPYESGIPTE